MNADLLRQRRNLIVVSGVLLIFDFSQVKVAKVSVLGTDLLIGNAQVLVACAWILWAYFLLRYYQYWRAETENRLGDAFAKRFDGYVRAYTKATAVRDELGQANDRYRVERVGPLQWTYTLQHYDVGSSRVVDGTSHRLPAWRMLVWTIRAVLYVGLNTHHATDHVLPFLLAVAAPAVSIATAWRWI